MSKFGKALFSGSRFIFWSLFPILALCAVSLPVLFANWSFKSFLAFIVIETLFLSLILGLYNPHRFRWATRCVTGIVFCAYLAYLVEEIFLSGKSFEAGSGSRAESSPRNAILGFLAIGLPCLWYTIFGRFTLKDGDEAHGSEPETSSKVETIDVDI